MCAIFAVIFCEIPTARKPIFSPCTIAGLLEAARSGVELCEAAHDWNQIDNRFRRQPRDRSAANVMYENQLIAEHMFEIFCFANKSQWPFRGIFRKGIPAGHGQSLESG